jgi:hypothetical protein
MKIAIFPFALKGDISTSLVTTHNLLGLSNSSSTSVKASWGKLCANLSNLITGGLSSWSLARTLGFLANPPNYFKFRFSIFNKKDVLWPYPGSIITIPG